MAMETIVKAKPTLSKFLFRVYNDTVLKVRDETGRNYTQKEFAETIGINANTFGRYLNGETSATLDNVVVLLRYFGMPIVPHFNYSETFDQLTAEIIASLPTLDKAQQKQIEGIIHGIAEQAESTTTNNSTSTNGNLVSA